MRYARLSDAFDSQSMTTDKLSCWLELLQLPFWPKEKRKEVWSELSFQVFTQLACWPYFPIFIVAKWLAGRLKSSAGYWLLTPGLSSLRRYHFFFFFFFLFWPVVYRLPLLERLFLFQFGAIVFFQPQLLPKNKWSIEGITVKSICCQSFGHVKRGFTKDCSIDPSISY